MNGMSRRPASRAMAAYGVKAGRSASLAAISFPDVPCSHTC